MYQFYTHETIFNSTKFNKLLAELLLNKYKNNWIIKIKLSFFNNMGKQQLESVIVIVYHLMIDYVHIKEQWQEDTIISLSVIDYFPYKATYWK